MGGQTETKRARERESLNTREIVAGDEMILFTPSYVMFCVCERECECYVCLCRVCERVSAHIYVWVWVWV